MNSVEFLSYLQWTLDTETDFKKDLQIKVCLHLNICSCQQGMNMTKQDQGYCLFIKWREAQNVFWGMLIDDCHHFNHGVEVWNKLMVDLKMNEFQGPHHMEP